MKNCLFLTIALVVGLTTLQAQDVAFVFDDKVTTPYQDQVRIHIIYINPSGWIFNKYRLHTSLQEEPVKLHGNDYTLLVTDEETIAFFSNDRVNNLPLQLTFQKGKDYYFRFIDVQSTNELLRPLSVDELTEREFQMQLFANSVSPKPIIYDLRTVATEIEQ